MIPKTALFYLQRGGQHPVSGLPQLVPQEGAGLPPGLQGGGGQGGEEGRACQLGGQAAEDQQGGQGGGAARPGL